MWGSWWWDLLLGIAAGLLLAWVALIVVLVIVRPRGGLLREALRLLPDVLRLLPRLAADRSLPRCVRVRLALLLAYLASPSIWCQTSFRWSATTTTRSSLPPCCGRRRATQVCRRLSAIGLVAAMDSRPCAASPG
jgi:hypothetical protein